MQVRFLPPQLVMMIVLPGQVVERETRDAQNVVPQWRGSSTLPLVTAEWTGVWFPARFHKPFDAGSNPASANREGLLAEYANWQSGQVESLVIVCGFDSHLGYWQLIPWDH